jgi:hypothetical protein
MSGYVRGKIECYICNKNENYNVQNVFKNLYDFFTSHPNYTLIALNYGSTNGPASSGAGTGTGYVDAQTASGGATFGNNAWFVVRANPTVARSFDVYHFFQWTGSLNSTNGQAWGTTNGQGNAGYPGYLNGVSSNGGPINQNYAYIGYQCAIGISGSGGPISGNQITGPGLTGFGGSSSGSLAAGFGNPWRGGMNALTGTLGIDVKCGNAPTNGLNGVWGAPPASGSYGAGTGVMIFPRSNDGNTGAFQWGSTGGHFAENCACIVAGNANLTSDMRMHIVADDDSWVFWFDGQDTYAGSPCSFSYSGLYNPRNGLPYGQQATLTPYCVIMDGVDAMPWSTSNETVYGDIAGTSGRQGGIIGNLTASVRPLVMDLSAFFQTNTVFNPNSALSSSIGGIGGVGAGGGAYYDEYDIPVGIFEATPVQMSGYLGQIDFIRTVFNAPSPMVRWDFNRLFITSSPSLGQTVYSIPWDSQNRTVPRSGISRAGITFVRPGPP